MEKKRLFKSLKDRKICGVCGGIAEYLNMDSTLVRIGWIFFSLFCGSGIIAYILCAIVIPETPEE